MRGKTMSANKIGYTFLQLALDALEESDKPLSVDEIWDLAVKKGYAAKIDSQGKTPKATLSARIYVELRDNPNTKIEKASTRPTKFSLKGKASNETGIGKEKCKPDTKSSPLTAREYIGYTELDLHNLLVTFVNVNQKFNCLCKTINDKKSTKAQKGVNEWAHPDIVGVHFYDDDYSSEVVGLQKKLGYRNFKLFSFEMKKALSFDNLRECYFQAVSNSSWANEGYLVAYEISGDDDFLKELGRLNNAFGIGIIKLNPKMITQSEILFPSKISNELDWDTVEKLSCINKEFKNFLLEITSDKRSNNIKKIYDEPLQVSDRTGREVDEICADYALKKHIISGDEE